VIALICGVEIELVTVSQQQGEGGGSRGKQRRGEERFSTNCGRNLLTQPYTKHYNGRNRSHYELFAVEIFGFSSVEQFSSSC